jgi:hypothetical protein
MWLRADSMALLREPYDSTHRVRILPISRMGVKSWHDGAELLGVLLPQHDFKA